MIYFILGIIVGLVISNAITLALLKKDKISGTIEKMQNKITPMKGGIIEAKSEDDIVNDIIRNI